MNEKLIPLSVPTIAGNEWKYVKDCLDTGWISSVGAYVTEFENKVAEFTGAGYAVATVNGTAALHICLNMVGVGPEDHVIIPNITFVATANSVWYTGAEPILIDTNLTDWQMDLDILEKFLSEETTYKNNTLVYKKTGKVIRAIMPVHVLGNIFDMDRFLAIAEKYDLTVIEDSTEALGSTYKGKHAGRFGPLGTVSFNGNKVISTGGGGMIITDDEALAKKAKHLTTTAKTDPLEYFHDEVGYNYRLVNVLAAIGVAQMEQLPGFITRKKEVVQLYKDKLGGFADISFQEQSADVTTNGWLFTIRTKHRPLLIKELNKRKIICRPFWTPMNQLPMHRNCHYINDHDNSSKLHKSGISIPSSTSITNEEVDIVVKNIKDIISHV